MVTKNESWKTVRIPLIGWTNARGDTTYDNVDLEFLNTIWYKQKKLGDQEKFYALKRPAFDERSTHSAAGNSVGYLSSFQEFFAGASGSAYEVWTSGAKIYDSTVAAPYTSLTLPKSGIRFGEGWYQSQRTVSWIAYNSTSTAQEFRFWVSDAGASATSTFSGDLNSSTSITNVASTTGMYIGQKLTHASIPANTYITAISGTTLTISNAATATAAGQTITRTSAAFVTDADFPLSTVTGKPVYMDGYWFVLTNDGKLYNSDLNDITTWTATGYIFINNTQEQFLGLERVGNQIVAFGQKGFYYFYNLGNATGSPLARAEGGIIEYGTDTSTSVCVLGHVIYFVGRQGSSMSGTPIAPGAGIFKIENGRAEKLSDNLPDVLNYVYAIHAIQYQGKILIFLTDTSSDSYAIVYDSDINIWSKWSWNASAGQGFIGENGNYLCMAGAKRSLVVLFSADYSGTNNTRDFNTYTIDWSVVTSKLDFDTSKRKRFHRLTLVGDKEASTCNVTVTWSDDDYTNFTSARTIDMSSTQNYLQQCGSARRRAIKLATSNLINHRFEALEIDYSLLEHA